MKHLRYGQLNLGHGRSLLKRKKKKNQRFTVLLFCLELTSFKITFKKNKNNLVSIENYLFKNLRFLK